MMMPTGHAAIIPAHTHKAARRGCNRPGHGRTTRGFDMVQRNCQQCGKPFTTFESRIRNGQGKYCSPACGFEARRGKPMATYAWPSPEARFWAKVDKAGPAPAYAPHLGPCWLWTGAKIRGYGVLRVMGPQVRATRFAYELLVGPIPAGLHLDHLCRVPPCVNPAHLEPVTCRENLMRGDTIAAHRAAATHCERGHPFSSENTWIDRSGWRHCRECIRIGERRRAQRRRDGQ